MTCAMKTWHGVVYSYLSYVLFLKRMNIVAQKPAKIRVVFECKIRRTSRFSNSDYGLERSTARAKPPDPSPDSTLFKACHANDCSAAFQRTFADFVRNDPHNPAIELNAALSDCIGA